MFAYKYTTTVCVCAPVCVHACAERQDLGCPKASSALFSGAVLGTEHHCQAVSGTQTPLVPSVPALSTA